MEFLPGRPIVGECLRAVGKPLLVIFGSEGPRL
jgi:hypothetical protein